MSPIARAEPLAMTMIEVATNAGTSLRILLSPVGCEWIDLELLAGDQVQGPCHGFTRPWRGQRGARRKILRVPAQKCRSRKTGMSTATHQRT
jgi:hypothetical protein